MQQHEPQPVLQEILPKIDVRTLPVHDQKKFLQARDDNLIEQVYEDGQEIGFTIRGNEQIYEMDYEEGFFEPNGCYYDKDFEPKGWWVLDCNQQEYFYNINGVLDGEEDDDGIIQQS